ncbi:MAG: hypothetical protein ACE5G0_02985 [Rhodothermales bacterium]
MSTIPFQVEDVGLTEIHGELYLDHEFLVFVVETALLGEFRKAQQVIKIEPRAVQEIRLDQGIIKDKLCIRPKKRELLQVMPGRFKAEVVLKIWVKHRKAAEALVEKVRERSNRYRTP